MGITLTIAKGRQAGRSSSFEQPEVWIGRTSDNDVVLADSEVARRHLRLVLRSGRTFVEDLGGGAKVNGQLLKGTRELLPGDLLEVGTTELTFGHDAPATLLEVEVVKPPAAAAKATVSIAEQETRLLDPKEPILPEFKPPVRAPRIEPEPARIAELEQTRLIELAQRNPPAVPSPTGETRLIELVPAVSTPDEEATDPAGRAAPTPRSLPDRKVLDRSRLRRDAQESLGGLLRLTWAEATPRARQIALITGGALTLLLITALATFFLPDSGKTSRPSGAEPEQLTLHPAPDSFGLGADVDWEHADQKSFHFEVISPTPIAAVLHYRAEHLSEGELSLSLNGVDQGFAPADTANARTRDIALVISPSLVRRGAPNTLSFDSVKNPPGEDPWKISHVWIELLPVPELPPAKLLELAKEHARVAAESYETRAVSSGNLFRAWKSYRDAWLSLEGLDTQLHPELYQHVRFQLGTLGAELDRTCSRLTREFERAMTLNQRKQARRVVEELERVFPSNEHRCHNLARERRAELEL